jgi:hypothetical protein
MTSLVQNFFLALMRAIWRISRPRSERDVQPLETVTARSNFVAG